MDYGCSRSYLEQLNATLKQTPQEPDIEDIAGYLFKQMGLG